MGVHPLAFDELVSAPEHFSHVRVSIFRTESGRVSPDERFPSRDRNPLAVSLTLANYELNLAKRVRRRSFRNSSAASRIGRLDHRAQRCAQPRLLHADA